MPYVELDTPHRRAAARASVALRAVVFAPLFDAPVELDAVDLSTAGMFLASELLLEPGDPVRVRFTVPGTSDCVEAAASVMWATRETAAGAGMGLAFERLAPRDAAALQHALARRADAFARAGRSDGALRA